MSGCGSSDPNTYYYDECKTRRKMKMKSCAWCAHLLLFRLTNLRCHIMQHATMPTAIRDLIERANVLVPPTATVANVRESTFVYCGSSFNMCYMFVFFLCFGSGWVCCYWCQLLIGIMCVACSSVVVVSIDEFALPYDAACDNAICNSGEYRTGQCSGTTNNYSCQGTREHICLFWYIVEYL